MVADFGVPDGVKSGHFFLLRMHVQALMFVMLSFFCRQPNRFAHRKITPASEGGVIKH
jgi:hypothetical protein